MTLKYDAKDRAAIARGSYIVNALGGCVSCHTMPTFEKDGDNFKGEPKSSIRKITSQVENASGRSNRRTSHPTTRAFPVV